MRLKIFGIPKILLIFLGLLPTFLWCVFHPSLLSYHEQSLIIVLSAGAALTLIFTYCFCRGFFGARFGVLIFSMWAMGDALISSMVERDFLKLTEALFCFGFGIWIYFWLESRVKSADLNPGLSWFEGQPKLLPQIAARLKVGEEWVEGGVGSIDQTGFFVFLGEASKILARDRVFFELRFKGSEVEGTGRVNAHFCGAMPGFGLQFLPKDLYHFSQYTALVERLKGEGL